MARYGQAVCVPCPNGLRCDGSHKTDVKRGWWRAVEWHPMAVQCPYPETCLGTTLPGRAEESEKDVLIHRPDAIDATCAEGAFGALCASCIDTHRMARGADGKYHCLQCRAYHYS
eukprot:gene13107-biopygen2669